MRWFEGAVAVALAMGGKQVLAAPFVHTQAAAIGVGTYVCGADPNEWADIPGSSAILNVPGGTAFLTWSANFAGVCQGCSGVIYGEFRVVLGSDVSGEFRCRSQFNLGFHDKVVCSASSSSQIPPGEVEVKLQVRPESQVSDHCVSVSEANWTLIVFGPGNVPAVGNIGMVVMVVLLIGAAAVVLARRQRTA